MNLKKLGQIGLLTLLLAATGCGDNGSEEATPESDTTQAAAMNEAAPTQLNAEDPNVHKIGVTTMQCESCVMAVTKACESVEGVEEVDVRLGDKAAFVRVADFSPEKQAELEQAIAKSGYTTEHVERDADGYAKLPDCCKDGGMEKHDDEETTKL